jgi:hypothetical protein
MGSEHVRRVARRRLAGGAGWGRARTERSTDFRRIDCRLGGRTVAISGTHDLCGKLSVSAGQPDPACRAERGTVAHAIGGECLYVLLWAPYVFGNYRYRLGGRK